MEEAHRITKEVLTRAIAKHFNVGQNEIKVNDFDVTGKFKLLIN